MPIDFTRIQVERVIVHDIPARYVRGGSAEPQYSDVDSPLTPETKNYFREKVAGTLHRAAFDVGFDPESTSPVPTLVLDNLGPQQTDFIEGLSALREWGDLA